LGGRMSQASPSQNRDIMPNPPKEVWDFLKSAFSFFDGVLKALRGDTQSVLLWGFGVLFLVIIIVTIVWRRDLPPLAILGLEAVIVMILAALFIYTTPRVNPRKIYPKLDDIKGIISLHQQLEDLIYLERYLHDVYMAFRPCTDIIERANSSWHNPKVSTLQHNWHLVQQNQMAVLQTFIQSHPALSVQTWLPQVEKYSASIDDDLAKGALESLVSNILAYRGQLSQAEAHVRQQLNQVLADLIVISNQTLGRLGVPEQKTERSKTPET
jgi:hypothetical protein